MTSNSLNSNNVVLACFGQSLSRRMVAIPIRKGIETALHVDSEVVIDFEGVEATQSFVDELVGVLIVKDGPGVLKKIRFKRCSSTMKAIVKFVVADRTDQFMRTLGKNMELSS